MPMCFVSWVTENRVVPQTDPPLDAWRVSVAKGTEAPVVSAIIPSLDTRTTNVDVPFGTQYVATVTLVSSNGASVGPSASSAPFDVVAAPPTLPVPISVTAGPLTPQQIGR